MTELIPQFEGKEIRAIEQNGDVWIPIVDLAEAWNIGRDTVSKLIERNKRLFEGFTSLVYVTSTSTEIGKKINESARTTSHFLALTTGVLLQGFGRYEFTGEPLGVDA